MADPKKYVVYADGACIGNPGPGGWGVVIAEPQSERREFSSGRVERTTNNRMEITAAIEALKSLEPGAHVILRTDSEYLVKTMTLGWKRNVNQDLWNALDREAARRKVRFEWVPGHSGYEFNERADALARAASQGKEARPLPDEQAPLTADDADFAQSLEAMLEPGETIRSCANCRRQFVSRSPGETYCSLAPCQRVARNPH